MKKVKRTRTRIVVSLLLLQLSSGYFCLKAAPGDVDLSFDPGSGVNGPVHACVVQPDGKLIIGGQFTTVKGIARTNLARLNADGSGDSSFAAVTPPDAVDGAVSAVALQLDGKVLVGDIYYGLRRFNEDGSLDTGFNVTMPVLQSAVTSIAVLPDGKVVIGGYFTAIDGASRNRIARLNTNGSLDSSFNPGTGANGPVASIALQPDGKLLIGGDFERVDGTFVNGLARLNADGSLDNSYDSAIELDAHVFAIAIQPDRKVLVAANHGFVRLNANGSLDGSFVAFVSARSIALQPDGKILIGGYFSEVNETFRNSIARLNANGSVDDTFVPQTGAEGTIVAVVLQPDGRVVIGGHFYLPTGDENRIARLNADGSLDGTFNEGKELVGPVSPLEVQSNGKVLLASSHVYANSTNGNGRIRLNADGSLDSSFMPDSSFNPDLGVLDSKFGVESFVGPFVKQPDGKVLIGGYIQHYHCTFNGDDFTGDCTYWNRYFVARFNADGSRDSGFIPVIGESDFGLVETVEALAVQPDGKVIVGGTFSSFKGLNHRGIGRLNADGSLDGSFNPGSGVAGSVQAIALQPDGKVLIGGSFTAVNGTSRNRLARLNASGTLDTSFDPGNGANNTVLAIVLQPDGKSLIGGDFTTFNSIGQNRIARLNATGSLDSSFNIGLGASGRVAAIALHIGGNVLISGDFTTVNGVPRQGVARLYGDPVPSLNIARSGNTVIVSWPSSATGFVLQQSPDLNPANWTTPSEAIIDNGTTKSITAGLAPGSRFFRLLMP